MKKKIIIFGILVFAGMMMWGYHAIFADEFMFTEYSPDKQYRVDVYTKRNFISMPGRPDSGRCPEK